MRQPQPERERNRSKKNGKFATSQSIDAAIWSICDIMRRSNCAGALQYVPELTWILFLRILDEREEREAAEFEALDLSFTPSLEPPYRWRDWAAPFDGSLFGTPAVGDELRQGWKRHELTEGMMGSFFAFVNGELLPHLRGLRDRPNATPRQKMIGEI